MIRKIILALTIVLALGITSLANASSYSDINFNKVDFIKGVSFFDRSSNYSQELFVKNANTKDPVQRRGTENWEEPQGSFFVVPGLVLAVIGIAMFFNRD